MSVIQQALSILRRPGITAHVYQPGIGSINGLATSNFTLSDGSSGYTTIDGATGLVLDGMGALGSELVTNGTNLVNTTGWTSVNATVTAVSGELVNTGTAAGYPEVFQDFTTVANQTHIVTATIRRGTSANGAWVLAKRKLGAGNINWCTAVTSQSPTQIQFTFVALDDQSRIALVQNSGSADAGTVVFSNISCKPYTGIHASQSTTANKPGLVRGLRNLLTYSNDLSNAAWVLENSATKSGQTLLTPATNANVYRGVASQAGPATFASQLSGSGTCSMFVYNVTDGIFGVTQVTLTSTPTVYAINVSPTVATSYYYIGRRAADTATSITFGGAGIFQGTLSASDIIREGGIPITTTAAASNPSAGRYSWSFDGTDSLALGSVPFQQADDHMVTLVCRRDSLTGYTDIFGVGGASGTPMVSMLECTNASSAFTAMWRDDANTLVQLSSTLGLGEIAVFTARNVAGTRVLRKNGVQVATNTTSLGATTLTGAQIGSRITVGQYFTGAIGNVFPLKGTFTDADSLTIERMVASSFPGAPAF